MGTACVVRFEKGLLSGRLHPLSGPKSRKSRNGGQRHGQIHEKMRPAPPPARPTTWGPAPQRKIKSLGPAAAPLTTFNRHTLSIHVKVHSARMQSRACSAYSWKVQGNHAAYRRPNAAGSRSSSTSPTAVASRYWSFSASTSVHFSSTSQRFTVAPAHGRAFRAASQWIDTGWGV